MAPLSANVELSYKGGPGVLLCEREVYADGQQWRIPQLVEHGVGHGLRRLKGGVIEPPGTKDKTATRHLDRHLTVAVDDRQVGHYRKQRLDFGLVEEQPIHPLGSEDRPVPEPGKDDVPAFGFSSHQNNPVRCRCSRSCFSNRINPPLALASFLRSKCNLNRRECAKPLPSFLTIQMGPQTLPARKRNFRTFVTVNDSL